MRNHESNSGIFHVLGPTITHKVSLVYGVLPSILEGNSTEADHDTFKYSIEKIQDYIDSKLDTFEHKFLVFVCNTSQMHWVSVDVINPFLVFDHYLAEVKVDYKNYGARRRS
jgi:hypothetical protein